jgi:hypothetical protein
VIIKQWLYLRGIIFLDISSINSNDITSSLTIVININS